MTEGIARAGSDVVLAPAEAAPRGWKAVLCGACRAFGFAGGLFLCGAQLAGLAIALGLIVLLFAS